MNEETCYLHVLEILHRQKAKIQKPDCSQPYTVMCVTLLFTQEVFRDGIQLTHCQQKGFFYNKIHPWYFYNVTAQLADNYKKEPEKLISTSQALKKATQQLSHHVYIYFRVHFLDY